MSGYVIGNFLLYVVINAITPGPGNILALNTVGSYGWKRGRPLFFGIFAGYYVVQILCAVFVFGVSAILPGVLGVMKYVGAAYILWLAIRIAVSKPSAEGGEKTASFLKGFFLQFVNVKIYLFGVTALTGYVTDFSTAFWVLLLFELFIATMGTLATLSWIGMGVLLQKIYQAHFRPINFVLALMLLVCIYGMLQ